MGNDEFSRGPRPLNRLKTLAVASTLPSFLCPLMNWRTNPANSFFVMPLTPLLLHGYRCYYSRGPTTSQVTYYVMFLTTLVATMKPRWIMGKWQIITNVIRWWWQKYGKFQMWYLLWNKWRQKQAPDMELLTWKMLFWLFPLISKMRIYLHLWSRNRSINFNVHASGWCQLPWFFVII